VEFATAAEAMEIGRNGRNQENFWWHKSSELPEMALYHQIQVFCVKRPPSILESSWNIFFTPPIGNIVRFPDLFKESPIGVPLQLIHSGLNSNILQPQV